MDNSEENPTFLPNFCGARIVFVVVLVAQLLAVTLTLAQPPSVMGWVYTLAVYSLFVQWIALSCAGALCLCRKHLQHLPDYGVATISYLITLLITLLITEMAWFYLGQSGPALPYFSPLHGAFLIKSMGISAIVCALILRYFYVQHQWRRGIQTESEARFEALQSRIRPHFLFNCMNTIASLIRRQPEAAEAAVHDLADLFRASLADGKRTGTLQEEVALCKRYLRMEQQRLNDRLQVIWDVDPDLPPLEIPVLCLQPLIENAIYHGIEPMPAGGIIAIRCVKEENTVVIRIENPLDENRQPVKIHTGHHLAQSNIKERLAMFYQRRELLHAYHLGQNYIVEVRLPISP